MENEHSDEEKYLIQTLKILQEQYEIAAKPYVDRLVQIRSLQNGTKIMINIEQARSLGLVSRKV